ncbi:MAG TPA: pyruvate kinase [Methanofastidiosum sp.]|nr:pyruvate kinase [Methanofastidiosum sp.]HPA49557.1 pyruvate kinase [Methanofastidiosum sp.]HQK62320.1 pyruvate kinase [Methanofastidiosum sp.]HQM94723.1 pyruvate kinase [Methanofastidiosum sp.]HQQ48461.1 pyruvate kinase [Methanofastidiosum sp.]
MKKTKIVCTIGPSVSNYEMIKKLIFSGMNVARLNFSHGTHSDHLKVINIIKELSEETNKKIGILLDTKGPDIRVGDFENIIHITNGKEYIFSIKKEKDIIPLKLDISPFLKPNDKVLVDDGTLIFIVTKIEDNEIYLKALNEGNLRPRVSINIPGNRYCESAVTENDVLDIKFGIKNEVDFIALSFASTKEDVLKARELIKQENGEQWIISKIESNVGIKNIDDLIEYSEGIMVARGDLGVEIDLSKIPSVQRSIIEKCNVKGRPVIVATQMLNSMIENPRPTRAEVEDIASAIYSGADAVMLSGETAIGKYPVESVEMMVKVAKETEKELKPRSEYGPSKKITDVISSLVANAVFLSNAKAIVTSTRSGYTACMVARHKLSVPTYGVTNNAATARKLSVVWGINEVYLEKNKGGISESVLHAANFLKNEGLQDKDLFIFTAGISKSKLTRTNLLEIREIGEVLSS